MLGHVVSGTVVDLGARSCAELCKCRPTKGNMSGIVLWIEYECVVFLSTSFLCRGVQEGESCYCLYVISRLPAPSLWWFLRLATCPRRTTTDPQVSK